MNVEAKPEPGIETNGELKPVAIAFASIVLPVPGAPKKSRPRSRLPPARSNASPDCQRLTTRRTSSFASAWPRTSSSLTPHCASPGSKPRIWLMPIRSIGPIRIAKFEMKRKKTKITWVHSADVPSAEPSPLEEVADRAPPGAAAEEPRNRDQDDAPDRHLEPEAPEPGPAARDHVLLPQLRRCPSRRGWATGSCGGRAGRRSRGTRSRGRTRRAAPSTRASRSARGTRCRWGSRSAPRPPWPRVSAAATGRPARPYARAEPWPEGSGQLCGCHRLSMDEGSNVLMLLPG